MLGALPGSLMTQRAVLQCAVQFIAVPALLERTVNFVLKRTHTHLNAADAGQLSQRFTRAWIALSLVQGAARVIVGDPNFSALSSYRSLDAQYYTFGTLIYYVLDTAILAIQRSPAYDLWIHHLAAVGFSSAFLATTHSEGGWMLLCLCEALVPWGFQLFYFKLNEMRAHPWFRVVCYGGLVTLAFRAIVWTILFRNTLVDPKLPSYLWWSIVPFNIVAYLLDLYWFRLYLTNLSAAKKAAAELRKSGAKAPSLWSLFRGKKA